jgi:subtilisin-like proprotein convertase family protein
LNGSANLTAVPGQLQLTPNATSQLGGITVNAGVNALAYKVDFDFSTTPAGGADGFSYSFGDDVNAASTSPTAEMGSGTKFKVSFDSYGAMPNGAGIYILYNNTATSFNATTPGVLGYVANTSWVGTPNNHATIEINSQGQVTLTLNSTPLFTNVQLPAAYLSANKASWKHAIAARTGGISMEQLIDNLVIQTQSYSPGNTTYGSPVASTTTFYVSEVGTNGCYSATTPVTVTVLTPAEINSSVSETVSCVNVPITLMSEAPTASPAYTLSWESTPATGSGISGTISGDTITVTPTAGGTYTYIVTGTNGTCTDQDTLTVTINDFIPPAPTATTTNFNICAGTVSQLISTDPLASSGTQTVASGTVSLPINNLATTTSTLSMAGVPTGATITNMSVTFNATHTFDGDLDISLTGPNGSTVDLSSDNGGGNDNYVNTVFSNTASTAITAGTAPFTGTFLPEGNLTNLFSVPNGTYTLSVYDDASGDVGTINNWSISITYTIPPLSLVWYDAATAGNQVGSGTPYETVGSSVMPNTNTAGTYSFFATTESGGCLSATRLEFTVNVTEVLADLAPVNNTCNGGNTGSFTLGTIQCGSGNFLYSLTGGAPYGPIPTNLTAGTYSVTIQDQTTMGVSAPITVVITEPAAPSGLNATSVTYYDATLSWTENGSATSWTIIYGPTGFDPSTSGTVITGATNPYLLDNVLSAATSYQFYVFGECGPEADTSGPFTFATDQGFLTYDNQCTNYIDIQSSGTNLNLDDDTEAGVTLPFTFNYQNAGYTTLTVGNNGGLLLGTLTGNIGYGGNMTTLASNYIFAWGDDMDGETGDVFYQTVGTAPNQIAVFQWQNLNNFSNGAGTVTFQIQLFEATGEIYFVYQDVVFGASEAADNYAGNADIGISGATTDINVSNNNQTYLQNNSCVHFYNALCPNITNFNALIFPDEIDLSWNAGLYGETDWTVVYGYAGFDPTVSGEELGSFPYTVNAAQLTGLTQNTEYDVYIYSECMADNLTSDGYFYTFITPPFCANPTTVAVGTDVDSLEVTWNWAEYDPAYPINHFNIMYEMDGVYSNEVVANGVNFADTVVDPMLIGSGVYQVYVQAVCDNAAMTEDTSTWVGPITVVMPLSNDTVCGAEMLEMDYVYTLNNAGATVSVDEINIAPPATGAQETDGWANSTLNNTVWYRFVAPPSGSVRINNTAIAYNGQLAVYNVADCGDFNSNFIMVGANDNEIDGTSLAPNFTICGLTPGSVYYVLHDGTGTTGNYSISISEIVLEAGSALPLTQICYGEILDLNTTISGNDAGGVWSSQIAAVNASITGSDFNSTGLGYNTYNFQYRMTDGCAYDSIISQVHVFAPVNPGTDGAITICKNEPINLFDVLTGTADFNGQWYTPANAATPADIVGAASGGTFTYSYVVGNGVCPDDTSNAVVTVLASCDYTSIDEALFAGVQLYPNPTSGVINIDADKAYDVEITDANGRVIKKNISTSAGTTSIDLGKVQVGVYFVTLRTNDISKVFRVVVQ